MSASKTGRFGRRTVLSFLLCGAAAPALANAPGQSLRPIPKPSDAAKRAVPLGSAFIEAAKLGGKVSYVVADANTGEVLETNKPVLAHPPASVAKAMTALFALDVLGPRHRFRTRVLALGPIEGGRLKGDLVLEGSGDPVLDADDLFELAGRLKLAGLTGVDGKLLIYDGALPLVEQIDAAQPIQVGYNPGVSGLNLNFNRVFLEWKREGAGYAVSMDGRTERRRPAVGFARADVVDRGGPIFTYQNTDTTERWTVERKALGNGGGRWLPVRRPGTYAGDVFQTFARSHGIALPNAERLPTRPEGGTVLAEHLSPELTEICKDMLKFSTNLTAEAVGLAASGARSLGASGAAMSDWAAKRFAVPKAAFVDHSGLGDATQLTAHEMVKALSGPGARGVLEPILKEIALLDRDGNLMKNTQIKLVAKTGTLNFVSALAGYVRTENGRDLAFAIFASDLPRRRTLTKEQRERPRGARSWNGRAKRMHHQLIGRWAVLYDNTS